MTSVVVVGAQWGDEGKGKIVDWLASRAEVVVRFQGGHNAGHTLVIGETVYKLSALPSGIVRPNTFSVIGNGVVLDPSALLGEIEKVAEQGIVVDASRLMIAETVPLILPWHVALDQAREIARGKAKIGTTGRGIGPAYEDKIARRGIRLCDLFEPADLTVRLAAMHATHRPVIEAAGLACESPSDLQERLLALAPRLAPYTGAAWQHLAASRQAGKRILFEGAQGTLLDIDHGTYPFVTSSNTVAGQAAGGSGMGPGTLDYVLGIVKAYTTRVGAGPFPTELEDEVGELLGVRGHEKGTVTGRSRRCGWFDAALVRQAATISSMDGIALTKLDVLDTLAELKICVGYRLDGAEIDHIPGAAGRQARLQPVYETLPGWNRSTRGINRWADLPAELVAYVARIEMLVGVPVTVLSTGPERDETILRVDPFAPAA